MKRYILFFILAVFVLALGNSSAYAEEKPRVGVLRFTNNVAGLYWWHSSVADDLADLLASELVSTRAFQILERKEINAVFSEQDLSASGRVSQETMVQMKKVKGAKYLIAGTVSAFEESGSTGGGIRFKGISLGAKKSEVYIAVDVKIIDTETGEIVDARTIEGRAKATKVDAGLDLRNFSVGGEKAKNTPVGKAIRACVLYISEYLSCSLVEGLDAPCMDEWNKADAKRKGKTKKAISLD
ncbi:MAG TPA: CsgG/HfaB family protein [Candidatus Kapabacteria bacterium]|nr:CsgG/HfaB family protein [Candidatus Kapabacteria bacterium]